MGKIGIDANIILCILLPESTRTDQENVLGSERILKSLNKNTGITSSILLAEVAWAFMREGKDEVELEAARHIVENIGGLRILKVDGDIAWEAGKLRRKYYSKEIQISYQDAMYVASCVKDRVEAFYTTDLHLLKLEVGIPIREPKDF